MPDIVLMKPCTLSLEAGKPGVFWSVGLHKDVPDEVANHWFMQDCIAKDGKLPEPAVSAPLTNEERASVKQSLDAAEKRASDAEARAKTAEDERDGIKGGMDKLVADNEALRSRCASLEADLDKATKPPATPAPVVPKPAGK